jgi:DHA1 family bicyclomycin/chloramphenicol resistance-like MFS transporter
MAVGGVLNLLVSHALPPNPWWSMPPIGVFTFGWALMVPVVTLMVLDIDPERRGMAASLQACLGSAANALVAGVLAPLLMHSVQALAWGSSVLMALGGVAWWVCQRQAQVPAASHR